MFIYEFEAENPDEFLWKIPWLHIITEYRICLKIQINIRTNNSSSPSSVYLRIKQYNQKYAFLHITYYSKLSTDCADKTHVGCWIICFDKCMFCVVIKNLITDEMTGSFIRYIINKKTYNLTLTQRIINIYLIPSTQFWN